MTLFPCSQEPLGGPHYTLKCMSAFLFEVITWSPHILGSFELWYATYQDLNLKLSARVGPGSCTVVRLGIRMYKKSDWAFGEKVIAKSGGICVLRTYFFFHFSHIYFNLHTHTLTLNWYKKKKTTTTPPPPPPPKKKKKKKKKKNSFKQHIYTTGTRVTSMTILNYLTIGSKTCV